jgi:hypothetical protein
MRLLAAALGVLLISPMSGSDIERALALSRAREAERQQFHRRYITDLTDPVVTQIEVVTEFRRVVMIAEEHVLHGDWMFTRGVRAAEDAIRATRGTVTIRAQIRFNPLNTFIESPPYKLALGRPGTPEPPQALVTDLMPKFSVPFKAKDRRTLSSLIGCSLESTLDAARLGPAPRVIAVTLDGKETARTTVDFASLD